MNNDPGPASPAGDSLAPSAQPARPAEASPSAEVSRAAVPAAPGEDRGSSTELDGQNEGQHEGQLGGEVSSRLRPPAPHRPARRPSSITASAMVIVAALAILFAMREAQAVVVPTLVAIFLAVLADTPVTWLQKHGAGRVGATFMVVIAMVIGLLGLASLMTSSVPRFYQKAPEYEARLRQTFEDFLADAGGPASWRHEAAELLRQSTPETALDLATRVLEALTGLLGNAFLILILLIFILLEIPSLAAKIEALHGTSETLPSIAASIRRYLAIKTLTSLLTGAIVGLFLTVMGVDFAALWALMAFVLNYVPNIGSVIAAVPAVLLALVEMGPAWAAWVALGYVAINVFISNGLEPRWMGRGLGLSLLVVFLSLVLWGWLLGPLGMLLSVPLTASVRLAMLEYDSTHGVALLLGRKPITGDIAAELSDRTTRRRPGRAEPRGA